MGAVRANWHLGDLDLPEGDQSYMSQLQSTAKVIDLSQSEAELIAEFDDLLTQESRYSAYAVDENGAALECAVKQEPGHKIQGGTATSCFRCPSYEPNWRERPLGLLCRLGRRQEDVLDLLAAAQTCMSLDDEMALAFASEIEAAAELAEAFV